MTLSALMHFLYISYINNHEKEGTITNRSEYLQVLRESHQVENRDKDKIKQRYSSSLYHA